MNMNKCQILDLPMSQLMSGMGGEGLPENHPAAHVSIRQAWGMRAVMPEAEKEKISVLMSVFSNMTLEGLYDLRSRYETGDLNPQEKFRIAALKAAMQVM